jgi:DNA invertase Pin-like site-specific DNA recombinase
MTLSLGELRYGKRIDTVVVYKVDRLTRSLMDFARIVEQFDKQGISFVSVTQQFNTTTSMGRLTLNVLLSFAQFEREVTGEHIRDKISTRTQEKIQAFLKTIVTRVAAASGPPPSIASSDRQN